MYFRARHTLHWDQHICIDSPIEEAVTHSLSACLYWQTPLVTNEKVFLGPSKHLYIFLKRISECFQDYFHNYDIQPPKLVVCRVAQPAGSLEPGSEEMERE